MTRALRPLLCGLSGLLVLAGLAVAAPAQAAPVASLTASRSTVMPDENFSVVVRTGTRVKRPVVLKHRQGRTWRSVRTTTDARGTARITVATARRIELRATVPKVTVRGKKYKALSTKRVVVRTAAPAATVSVVTSSERVAVTGRATPARKGRKLSLQRLDGGTWRTIIAGRAGNAAGRVDFGAVGTQRDLGGRSFRVVAGGWKGAPRVTGAAKVVPSLPAPPRDPQPEEPLDEPDPEPTAEPTVEPTPEPAPAVTQLSVTIRGVGDLDPCTEVITTKTDYVNGTMTFRDRDGGAPRSVAARLRVRGNSTASIARKRPYKVKLDASASLLGMPASKDWVLLANHFDRSMLRNDLAMRAARMLGVPWAPRLESVDLRINGRLCGVYQFGEGIEAQDGRVELQDGDTLLEADTNDDTDPQFRTERGLRVFLKAGETKHVNRVEDAFQEVEDLLYDESFPDNGYRDRIDVDSFVTMYLVNELTKNLDAGFRNSVYLVMRADGTLAMGPPWDYDVSQGLVDLGYAGDLHRPTGWWIGRLFHPLFPDDAWRQALLPSQLWKEPGGHYYNRLLTDPWFVEQVRDRWREASPALATLAGHVDAESVRLLDSAAANFTPREDGGAGQLVWAAPEEIGSWTPMLQFASEPDSGVAPGEGWLRETARLRDWIAGRTAWIDEQFASSDG
ncbi:CotH kinase family protein [Aeromicrobium sp. Marseille-Q0843]|uniref:CotH kinase family protein n=1 Tax=Aeromicrobium phoceense TaxID=2754045 RepID=A0A838XIG6_9ACTN|nr:CotH kinase family protein [Aeromicrobium phoceense]MBA4608761.1 CotH kinase family protein [Aeromicrobium phoceense]